MGSKNRTKLDLLKAQLRQYACNETPYNETYVTNIDTPLHWWKTCGDGTKHNPGVLSTLAIKLFSVRPHSASCECICFLISNAKQELQYYGVDLTEEELLGVFQEAALVAETNDDLEEFVDLPDDSNIEYEDQQLLLDDLMDLTNPEFGNEDKDSNSEENDENDDNDTDSNNEDNEFDEDEFGAAFVQSLQNE
ncbi:12703_t:CDS:2 [Entrophospora sp. SA101]|nr:12703_t:CDS:2 [Entrophospora sp. SA101]